MGDGSDLLNGWIRPGKEVLGAVYSMIFLHEVVIQGKIIEEGVMHLAPEVEAVNLVKVLEGVEELKLSAFTNLCGHLDGVLLVRVPGVVCAGLLLHGVKRLLIEALGSVPT